MHTQHLNFGLNWIHRTFDLHENSEVSRSELAPDWIFSRKWNRVFRVEIEMASDHGIYGKWQCQIKWRSIVTVSLMSRSTLALLLITDFHKTTTTRTAYLSTCDGWHAFPNTYHFSNNVTLTKYELGVLINGNTISDFDVRLVQYNAMHAGGSSLGIPWYRLLLYR